MTCIWVISGGGSCVLSSSSGSLARSLFLSVEGNLECEYFALCTRALANSQVCESGRALRCPQIWTAVAISTIFSARAYDQKCSFALLAPKKWEVKTDDCRATFFICRRACTFLIGSNLQTKSISLFISLSVEKRFAISVDLSYKFCCQSAFYHCRQAQCDSGGGGRVSERAARRQNTCTTNGRR